jgi:hypothetical protein
LPATWRHEETYRLNKKLFIFDVILALIVLALIGSNIFLWLQRPTEPPAVSFNFSFPKKIISGQEIEFILNYHNESKENLKEANLTLKLPSYFILKQILPSDFNEKTNTLFLGDLSPGANGQIKIKGYVIGPIGESQKISAILSWKDTSEKLRQKIFSQTFLIEDSALKLSLNLPEKIFNETSFDLVVEVENSSELDFEVEMALEEPEGFYSSPESYSFSLNPNEKKEIKITGLISRQKPLDQNKIKDKFKAQLFIEKNNQRLLQAEKERSFILIFPNFNLKQEAKSNAFPGQDLEYLITYQNKEKVNLQNLEIKIELEGEFFDLENIVAEDSLIEENQIIWKTALLKPNESAQKKFKIKILREVSFLKPEENYTLSTHLSASYKMADQPTQIVKVKAEDLIIKVNSNLKLEADLRYFTPEGDQIGRGPWPPKAGEETKAWVFLRVTNTINKIKNAALNGSLTSGIVWTGKTNVTQGRNLTYDKDKNQFSWLIGEIPKYTGFIIPSYEAAFEIAFVPSVEDMEKEIVLVKNLEVIGEDKFTGDKLSDETSVRILLE